MTTSKRKRASFTQILDDLAVQSWVQPVDLAVYRALLQLSGTRLYTNATRQKIASVAPNVKLYEITRSIQRLRTHNVIELVDDPCTLSRRKIFVQVRVATTSVDDTLRPGSHKSLAAHGRTGVCAPGTGVYAPGTGVCAPVTGAPIKDPAHRSLSIQEVDRDSYGPSGPENQIPQRQRSNPERPAVAQAGPLGGALATILGRLPAAPVETAPVQIDAGVKVPQPAPDGPKPPASPAPPPAKPSKPVKTTALTPSQSDFLAMLTVDERASWDALKAETREMYLQWFSVDISPVMLKEVMPKLRPRNAAPQLPADDGTRPIHDFIDVLVKPGGHIYARSVTDVFLREIGDGSQSFRFWEGVLRGIAVGELPSTVLLSPYDAVAKMQADGKQIDSIPAYMARSVKARIATHFGSPPGAELSAQKPTAGPARQSDPGGRSQIQRTSLTQGRL